jgi:NADH-quinone oxidoreductase subunit M
MPRLTTVSIVLMLAAMGLPALAGFPGEFAILLGAFQTRTTFAAAGVFGLFLLSALFVWTIERIFFGKVTHEEERHPPDLRVREAWILMPAVAIVLLFGIWPQGLFKNIVPSSNAFVILSHRIAMFPSANTTNPPSLPGPEVTLPAPEEPAIENTPATPDFTR